jgi:hypothetical protein
MTAGPGPGRRPLALRRLPVYPSGCGSALEPPTSRAVAPFRQLVVAVAAASVVAPSVAGVAAVPVAAETVPVLAVAV